MRLSVGAVNVPSGNFAYFDNVEFKKLGKKIGPEHIMASGALPPGFPPIEIDGEHYWDGGLVSNTPLEYVLDQRPDDDLLIFQVDLFSARGDLPQTLILEAAEREKDIRYSSRTRLNTDKPRRFTTRKKAAARTDRQAAGRLKGDPLVATLSEAAKENTVTVVHLIYRSKAYEASSKDYDFSRIGDGRTLGRGRARCVCVQCASRMARPAASRRDHGHLRSRCEDGSQHIKR